jgi:uncharacterized FlgJ-related protein
MIYTFDKNRVKFNKIGKFKLIIFIISSIFFISSISYLIGYKRGIDINIESMNDFEKVLVVETLDKTLDKFTEDKLISLMKELKIQFPHIVFAQSMLETSQWKSNIFHQNHNLFGMKASHRRVTTSKGSNLGHAYYDNWRESVYDYAFYQCRYLNNIKDENHYFSYLKANYAEDSLYIQKVKELIQRYNLKSKFE